MGFCSVTAIYSLLRLRDGKKWIPALYVFSRPLVFATIPKRHKASPRDCRLRLPPIFHQFYLVAASSQLSFIGMGMAFPG